MPITGFSMSSSMSAPVPLRTMSRTMLMGKSAWSNMGALTGFFMELSFANRPGIRGAEYGYRELYPGTMSHTLDSRCASQ